MFFERRSGNFEITVGVQFDSAYKARYLLPALSYIDNFNHIDWARDGHVKLYRAIKLQFWRWIVTLRQYTPIVPTAEAAQPTLD